MCPRQKHSFEVERQVIYLLFAIEFDCKTILGAKAVTHIDTCMQRCKEYLLDQHNSEAHVEFTAGLTSGA